MLRNQFERLKFHRDERILAFGNLDEMVHWDVLEGRRFLRCRPVDEHLDDLARGADPGIDEWSTSIQGRLPYQAAPTILTL